MSCNGRGRRSWLGVTAHENDLALVGDLLHYSLEDTRLFEVRAMVNCGIAALSKSSADGVAMW